MKAFVQVGVVVMVVMVSLIAVGSSLKCYKCQDSSVACSNNETCSAQSDACLTLKNKKNGRSYQQCIRSSDCHTDRLQIMFPDVASFHFRCCSRDLCNGASVIAARTSVITLLLSLVLFWCIF